MREQQKKSCSQLVLAVNEFQGSWKLWKEADISFLLFLFSWSLNFFVLSLIIQPSFPGAAMNGQARFSMEP